MASTAGHLGPISPGHSFCFPCLSDVPEADNRTGFVSHLTYSLLSVPELLGNFLIQYDSSKSSRS